MTSKRRFVVLCFCFCTGDLWGVEDTARSLVESLSRTSDQQTTHSARTKDDGAISWSDPLSAHQLYAGQSSSGEVNMLRKFLISVSNKFRVWSRAHSLLLIALTPALALAQSPPLHIRVINAQTNKPVTNERLNVALRVDQIGLRRYAHRQERHHPCRHRRRYHHPNPLQYVRRLPSPRRALHRLLHRHHSQRPASPPGNLCSSAKPSPPTWRLVLYEIPKTYIPGFGQPPASNLPHSDENPHAPQTPPQ